MAAQDNLGRQWHGSLENKGNPHPTGGDKYNRPAERLSSKPPSAAKKGDPFKRGGYGGAPS